MFIKGTQSWVNKDDKLGWTRPYAEFTTIFNNMFVDVDNLFIDHPHGDDDLLSLHPDEYTRQTDVFF